ncbi:MAG: MerR family transcriptional regulator [Actinomycetia bacterium]|nr:MerR family transcriptional regulator [Actinomycetes bacterium]
MGNDVNDREMLISIKDFADYVGVKQSLLRYYDEIGLFKPIYRGDNNYRYYSLKQIQTIKLITTLQTLKVPLKEIESIISRRTTRTIDALLVKHEMELAEELSTVQRNFSIIHTLRSLIQSASSVDADSISIKYWEGFAYSMGAENDFRDGEDSYHRVFSDFYRNAHNMHIDLNFPIGGYFRSFDDFLARPSLPHNWFSHDPNGFERSPVGYYVVGYTRGDYGVMGDLPQRLAEFVEQQQLGQIGPVYQSYLLNEVCEMNPDNYLVRTSVFIPGENGGKTAWETPQC